MTPAETQGVVRAFLGAHPEFRLDPFPHPLTEASTDGTLLIWPQDADTDSMFIARMIRTGEPKEKPRARPAPADAEPPEGPTSTG